MGGIEEILVTFQFVPGPGKVPDCSGSATTRWPFTLSLPVHCQVLMCCWMCGLISR